MGRKQSQLNQADLAFIFGLSDYANISRWEQGHRTPSIEVLIAYHLLFDMPMESFCEPQGNEIAKTMTERIRQLLENLRKQKPSQKVNSRIAFLESVFTRLTT
jgi:transcriptional regulator with XRE-family HTH domain